MIFKEAWLILIIGKTRVVTYVWQPTTREAWENVFANHKFFKKYLMNNVRSFADFLKDETYSLLADKILKRFCLVTTFIA